MIKNTNNAKKSIGEISTEKSKTIPDQVLPLATLLERHTRGQNVPTYRAIFDTENDLDFDLPDLSKLDKTERIDYLNELRESIEDTRQDIINRAKQKQASLLKLEKKTKTQLEINKKLITESKPKVGDESPQPSKT